MLILGVAYKRDIDDLRESPSLTIIELLRKRGASSPTTTPISPPWAAPQVRAQHDLRPLEHLEQYDAVVIVTDHSCYEYARIVNEAQLVIDTRNATRGIDSRRLCVANHPSLRFAAKAQLRS